MRFRSDLVNQRDEPVFSYENAMLIQCRPASHIEGTT
jgi:hypothetical protein